MGNHTIWHGDVLAGLRAMPDNSVDCCVTSPPYWGLRDYGTGKWSEGDGSCDHKRVDTQRTPWANSVKGPGNQGKNGNSYANMTKEVGGLCEKCGAIWQDQQMGMEMTMSEHLANMVEVFAEVHRVLKPSGTCFVNYGDCYASSPNGRSAADTKAAGNDDRTFRDKPFSTIGGVLKPKDLSMVPNRFAIAMQEWGWWVRSEIIWAKPNPMPESIRDRPATAHEKVFMFTKEARYFWDAAAVRQGRKSEGEYKTPDGWDTAPGGHGSHHRNGMEKGESVKEKKDRSRGHMRPHSGFNDRWDVMDRIEQQQNGRNLRNYEPAGMQVWEIATQPFRDAHFATFPPELVERCLAAGCPAGGMVLDPFGGSGTTSMVADYMGCDSHIIELNPDYVRIAWKRVKDSNPMLANVAVENLQMDFISG